ncbi:hypothetical protein MRY87_13440 [bacterium]|nr:hypothetical protein [bacterium]
MIFRQSFVLVLGIFLLVYPAFSSAEEEARITVQWSPRPAGLSLFRDRSFSVLFPLSTRETRECIDAGLELEHRFLFRLCRQVNGFTTDCRTTKRVVHNLSYDPIQDAYRIMKDRLDDQEDPTLSSHRVFDDSLGEASLVRELPIWYVLDSQEDDPPLLGNGNWSIGMRVRTTCKGEMREFLADLSYFVSFGIIDIYGTDSGCEYFRLVE